MSARTLAVLSGIGITLSVGSAQSFNGDSAVISCADCSTTGQFVAAAVAQNPNYNVMTYTVVSQSRAMSAYVQFSGSNVSAQLPDGSWITYWEPTLGVVDSNGAPLDGYPEDSKQLFYNTLDQTFAGTTRGDPVWILKSVPPGLETTWSFVNSSDSQVSIVINARYSVETAGYNVGDIVTVKFPDGTTAQFKLVANSSDITQRQWQWTGKAWDTNGNPIHRDGSRDPNPNTTGGGAGASPLPPLGRTPTATPTRGSTTSGLCAWHNKTSASTASSLQLPISM